MFSKDIVERLLKGKRIRMDYEVNMLGSNLVMIEGHRGIETYSSEEIRLKTRKNYLSIRGTQLLIDEINDVDIIISGTINIVEVILYEK